MDKIYSRTRIKIPKIKFFFSPNGNSKKSKLLKICIALLSAITAVVVVIMNSVMPVLERLCINEAKGIGNKICNDAVSNSIVSLDYNDLIDYVQDGIGNITMIKSNTVNMNKLASEITARIQNDLNNLDKTSIKIPLGTLSNNQFFYGIGPDIDIQIRPTGNLGIDFQSEFMASGINQTIHRIYLTVNCKIYILGSITNYLGEINEKVPVAETIIVGNVPSSYYNLEGLEVNDTTTLMEE